MITKRNGVKRLINGIGIGWGAVSFAIGVIGSFTLNSVHLVTSLLVLIFGFLIVFPIAIFARRRPGTAAIALAASFAITVCSVWAAETAIDGARVATRLIFPDGLLVCAYAYLSYARPKEDLNHDDTAGPAKNLGV